MGPVLWAATVVFSSLAADNTTRLDLTLPDALVHHAVSVRMETDGVRREDARLTLQRSGDRWQAVVLTSPDAGLDRRLDPANLDASALHWDGDRLYGVLRGELGRFHPTLDTAEGENTHSALKARRRNAVPWDLGGRARVERQPLLVEITATNREERVFSLTLLGALPGANADADLQLELRFADGRWRAGDLIAPQWNRGLHRVEGMDLHWDAEVLRGEIDFRLQDDPWKSHASIEGLQSPTLRIELTSERRADRLEGRYRLFGDGFDRSGVLRGTLRRDLRGRYRWQDGDGERYGEVRGLWTHEDSGPPETRAEKPSGPRLPLPDGPTEHHHPLATPPRYWDLKTGSGVVWRKKLGVGGGRMIAHEHRLFVLTTDGIWALRLSDGGVLWHRALPDMGPKLDWSRHGDELCVFGNARIAVVDLEGTLRWQHQVPVDPARGEAHPPQHSGGRWLVQGTLPKRTRQEEPPRAVFAVDREGVRWKCELPAGPGPGLTAWSCTNGTQRHEGVSTRDGWLLDAESGTRLLETPLFPEESPGDPLWLEPDFLFVAARYGQKRVALQFDSDGAPTVETRWAIRRPGGSSPQRTAPPLVWDGLLYLARSSDENAGHHPVPWSQLDVYEVERGQHLARLNPLSRSSASPLAPLRSGQQLLFSDDGGRGYGKVPAQATVAWVEPGERPWLRLRVELAPGQRLATTPLPVGDQLFLRVDDELICLRSPDGGEREAYWEARTVLEEIGPEPRLPWTRLDAPTPADPRPDALPVETLQPGVTPRTWLRAGPWPQTETLPDPEALSRSWVVPGTKGWRELPANAWADSRAVPVLRGEWSLYQESPVLDLAALLEGRDAGQVRLYTVLRVEREQVLRPRLDQGRSWLAGIELTDQTVLRLEPGEYPWLIEVGLARLPPTGRPRLAPAFLPMPSPQRLQEAWREAVALRRPVLEEVALRPDGLGLRARRLLDLL